MMQILQGIVILFLDDTYDIEDLTQVMALVNSEEIKSSEYVIIDGEKFTNVNVIGAEIFLIREKMKNQSKDGLIFCNLNESSKWLFNQLSRENGFGEILHFINLKDAINYIKEVKT